MVRARSTAACGRFGQVAGIAATGAVRAGAPARTLAAPWTGPDGAVSLTGTLAGGGTVTALDGAGGGRD